MMSATSVEPAPQLLGDIRQLIEQSRQQLASTVNSTLTQLYWHIGQRIRTEVLQGQRAGYGEGIVSAQNNPPPCSNRSWLTLKLRPQVFSLGFLR